MFNPNMNLFLKLHLTAFMLPCWGDIALKIKSPLNLIYPWGVYSFWPNAQIFVHLHMKKLLKLEILHISLGSVMLQLPFFKVISFSVSIHIYRTFIKIMTRLFYLILRIFCIFLSKKIRYMLFLQNCEIS